jgi:hypothetical protein
MSGRWQKIPSGATLELPWITSPPIGPGPPTAEAESKSYYLEKICFGFKCLIKVQSLLVVNRHSNANSQSILIGLGRPKKLN